MNLYHYWPRSQAEINYDIKEIRDALQLFII